jgi:hypothetical protein
MFFVSVADGLGSGDGVTAAVLGLLPHATTRMPTAIAARKDLSILKV